MQYWNHLQCWLKGTCLFFKAVLILTVTMWKQKCACRDKKSKSSILLSSFISSSHMAAPHVSLTQTKQESPRQWCLLFSWNTFCNFPSSWQQCSLILSINSSVCLHPFHLVNHLREVSCKTCRFQIFLFYFFKGSSCICLGLCLKFNVLASLRFVKWQIVQIQWL